MLLDPTVLLEQESAGPAGRLSRREPDDFGQIFDSYIGEIYGYISHRLGPQAAEDVAAETFAAAFRQRDRYDPERASVRTWLYGIAANLIRRHRRSEVRALRALGRIPRPAPEEGHADRVSAKVSATGMNAVLSSAIARLNSGEREVLTLIVLADLSHEEVAAALRIAPGTVRSRLSRAKQKMRRALGGQDPLLDREEENG